MRLIDADALIQAADKMFENIDSPLLNHLTTYDLYSLINNAPTVERPQGEWVNTSPCDDKGECLLCCYLSKKYYDFCPNCGAKMKKE